MCAHHSPPPNTPFQSPPINWAFCIDYNGEERRLRMRGAGGGTLQNYNFMTEFGAHEHFCVRFYWVVPMMGCVLLLASLFLSWSCEREAILQHFLERTRALLHHEKGYSASLFVQKLQQHHFPFPFYSCYHRFYTAGRKLQILEK